MVKVFVQSLPDYTHAQLLTAPGRALVADEPHDEGGDSLGPTPYELLTWALGTCTAMTLQIYARRKGYPLEEIAVEVEHERVHKDDSTSTAAGAPARIELLRRTITVRGPLSDEQREDLLRVAARCPVHRTLTAPPQIVDAIEQA